MNIAMADLITLCVGLPFELIMNWSQYPWPFPDLFCNLKALIAETTKLFLFALHFSMTWKTSNFQPRPFSAMRR